MSDLSALAGGSNFALDAVKMLWSIMAQQNTWSREDNAVQRRVADLNAAGLNPVLAAGSAAQASGPISIGQPEGGWIEKGLLAAKLRQDFSKTEAETELVSQQARAAKAGADVAEKFAYEDKALDLALKRGTLESNVRSAALNAERLQFEVDIREVQANVEKVFGMMKADQEQAMRAADIALSKVRLTEAQRQIAQLEIATKTAIYNYEYFSSEGLAVQNQSEVIRTLVWLSKVFGLKVPEFKPPFRGKGGEMPRGGQMETRKW